MSTRDPSAADEPAGDPSLGGRLRPVERSTAVPLRRVRKSYEQVADQLRELIVAGQLLREERLPNETQLAQEFGVSRATVREALRLLTAQSLIRTAKGAGGGSYVTVPTVDHLSELMGSSIGLLASARDLTLEELIEARELLEVPAARLAARRRRDGDVERLRASIPADSSPLGTSEEFIHNRDFHSTLIECCGNQLLRIAAQPIFLALQTSLSRSGLTRQFHVTIHRYHARIVEAVEAGDEEAAVQEMRDHLHALVPAYEKAWRHLRRS